MTTKRISVIKEEKIDNQQPIWLSKEGPIAMDQMSDEHLQKALWTAERGYMNNNNEAIHRMHVCEVFELKMRQLVEEASKRGIVLKSLAATSPDKFQILKSCYID